LENRHRWEDNIEIGLKETEWEGVDSRRGRGRGSYNCRRIGTTGILL
jgi:hypothetical protein